MKSWRLALGCMALLITLAAPLSAKSVRHNPHRVDGRYMVLIDQKLPPEAFDGIKNSLASTYHGQVATEWRGAFRGFVLTGVSSDDADRLVGDPRVFSVEEDFVLVRPTSDSIPIAFNGANLWYLDRIDQRDGLDSRLFVRDQNIENVVVYLIDTGAGSQL